MGLTPFALLDDCDASLAAPTSRLYTGLVGELASYGADDAEAVCAQAERALRDGLHAIVLADYEWGTQVSVDRIARAGDAEQACVARANAGVEQKAQAGRPALRFLLFSNCEHLSREAVDAWLVEADHAALQAAPAGLARIKEDTPRERFDDALAQIRAALERGDTYQINYTYRLGFDVLGSPVSLYRRLRARQPVRYGALIALPDARFVLSCSPELFLQHEAGMLRAQPMKGTAARVDDPDEDARVRAGLRADPKNRAENLMIVDLLRNDIGRVAQTGSVEVPALFSVGAYGRVWQMTSTVRARIDAGRSFAELMRALFPCGSITGAPKHRAMELIAELETSPRGLYTGSIGWLDAPTDTRRCGNFCLSVAIRTLVLDADTHRGEMGVGAGIVLDSVAASEWDECKVKAGFATGNDAGLALFETMRATRAGGVAHLDRHLARLVHSAAELGMKFDPTSILEHVNAYLPQLSDGEHRVKVTLDAAGAVTVGGGPLTPLPHIPVKLVLAAEHGYASTDADDPLLRYKTTRRDQYDSAWRAADTQGAFDMLFFNTRGELTEGGRSNVFVKRDGHWWTPPLSSGLLPGVMRAIVLADPQWHASERVLTHDDLLHAEDLMVCNALRGPLRATLG
ncbi:aminodeoxychorismate synthase component I [Pararobbsia alpina]|uniref:Isochorismate synthase MenF n=1 Tax=Pararobbsia alpina TaxID=621374 RepID=A0A6S7ATZ7_9BURK|nr:aminodeoxychorismate synthase component I [Pararobbsia alpina]CAB3776990.1 Isochorismate synthase MenF [Pararobbsia alpina]